MNRRKNNRTNRTNRNQRGGAINYPDDFGTTLDASMRDSAGISKLDAAFAELPQFAGSYGMLRAVQDGGRRRNRTNRTNRKSNRKNRKSRKNNRKNRKSRKQRGGAFGDLAAPVNAPANLMSKDMYASAHTNPQFYNENVVNPNFNGPTNSYA
jgi:hypothetical protein